jgi:hypothetical protein
MNKTDKAETDTETLPRLFPVIEQSRAREMFAQVRKLRDNIDAALRWDETLTKYQRVRLTKAANLLEQADTELYNLERSFHRDAAGYAIEK